MKGGYKYGTYGKSAAESVVPTTARQRMVESHDMQPENHEHFPRLIRRGPIEACSKP